MLGVCRAQVSGLSPTFRGSTSEQQPSRSPVSFASERDRRRRHARWRSVSAPALLRWESPVPWGRWYKMRYAV